VKTITIQLNSALAKAYVSEESTNLDAELDGSLMEKRMYLFPLIRNQN
jgi:hypothetical protein